MSDKFDKVQRAIWKPGTLVEVGYEPEFGIVVDFAGESHAYINIMVNGVLECIVNPLWNRPFSDLPRTGDMNAIFQPLRLMPDNPYYDTVAASIHVGLNRV